MALTSAAAAQTELWTGTDIGAIGLAGTSSYDSATDAFSLKAAGADINGVRDGFRFVHQSAAGNVQIVAQVDRFVAAHPWAKAGLMIRQGIADNAPFAAIVLTQKYGVQFLTRSAAGDSAAQTPPSPPWSDTPVTIWLKLVRNGNTIRAYQSPNATDWFQVGLITLALPNTTEVGLALTSHDTGAYATARFTGLRTKTPVFGTALFATGQTLLNSSELAIKARLENIGYAVTSKRAADFVPADATGKSIVLVSDTVASLPASFASVSTPVVTWSPTTFGALALTGGGLDDAGLTEKSEEALTIVTPGHPLAAGYSGNVKVALPANMTWGRPSTAAVVVATGKRRSTEDDPTLFAYEVGAGTFKGPAPARRVAMFLTSEMIGNLLDSGWQLFEAAIAWAANVPPTVAVTAPPFGSIVLQGNPISLQAAASDSDGTVVRVEFWVDGTKVGESTQAPYAAVWSNPMSGVYSITAVAIDNRNGRTTSDPVAIIVNAPPTAMLTAPLDGAVFQQSQPIALAADARDSDGTIKKVTFLDGTRSLGERTASPYTLTWTDAALGFHTLKATALDNYDAMGTSPAVHIFVNAPPTVTLTAPAEGATLPLAQPITLSATASDTDGAIARVEFFVDGASIGQKAAAPFEVSWTTVTSGSHALTAVATDNNNGVATSPAVHVVVNAPPAVALTSPASGTIFSVVDSIVLTADASDLDGQVKSVAFQADGTTIATVSAPPFTYAWTGASAGAHALRAVAVDNLGASTTSATRNVSVVTDKDGDGLPDAWEVEHFGNLDAGPSEDPDGDGLTNLREYQTGRDPKVADPDAVVLAPTDLVLYLRSDRGIAAPNGTAVSTWADQSGNGNDATATTPEQSPAVVANQVNGLPVVRFDGAGNKLGVDLHTLAASDYTIVGVVARRSAKAPAYFIGSPATLGLGYSAETALAFSYGAGAITASTSSFSQPTFLLLEADFGGTSGHRLLKNGKSTATDTNTVPLATVALSTIGSDGVVGFDGDIAEAIVYRTKLDDTTRAAIEKYLLAKYAIKVGGDPKPGDIDGDGLLDTWEMKWFGNLDHDGDEDFDGDGLTNRQEMNQGSDPTDYYNGHVPGLIIAGGNNQTGLGGEFLPQPLAVQVIGEGGRPLPNAPVTFSLVGGSAGLAPAFSQATTAAIAVRADATGYANGFAKIASGAPGPTITVECAAISGTRKTSVLFSEQTLDWFPSPRSLVFELNSGGTAAQGITLQNPTGSPVNFSVSALNTTAAVDYVMRTSDQSSGPAYAWRDIRSPATWLKKLSLNNNSFSPIDLSFSFPFYGRSFSRVFVNTNGFLTFDQGSTFTSWGDNYPSPWNPVNSIAPFFYDLDPSTGGEIYALDEGDRVTIQYDGMRNGHSDHTTATFQVVLHRTGEIELIYKSIAHPEDAIAGIQNGDASKGVSVQTRQLVVLKSSYAISLNPVATWLAISPASGTLASGEKGGVGVNVDATGLPGGTYSATINLHSDYPGRESIDVPVTLVVNAAPVATITSPLRTMRVLANQSIALTGTAADAEGPITKLELYDGGTKLGEVAAADYASSWSSAVIGAHTITLHATDVKGAVGVSAPLIVYVDSDSDGDGLGDEWENIYFGNLSQTASGDYDHDGLSNLEEYTRGLDPTKADTDGDGLTDQQEIAASLDALAADAWDDPDGDGYPNAWEIAKGTDRQSAASVPAPDFIVDPSGAGTHTTLQAALNATTKDYQIVLVRPGTYKGAGNTNISVSRKVMLISSGGAAVTKIDGENVNGGLTLNQDCLLRGFTIQNCTTSGVSASGGVFHRIEGCVIANCVSSRGGGGVYARVNVEARHCTIADNRADDGHGVTNGNGVYVDGGNVTLTNTICWNAATTDIYINDGTLSASHSTLRGDFPGVGNTAAAPLLTWDYHLRADAPQRGGGAILPVTSVDMDGEARPTAAAPDIGADQFVDTDNDGLPDAWEMKYFGSLSPLPSDDPDGDGLDNRTEYNVGTDPKANGDADGDGLSDAQEVLVYGTNPLKADTDGDGMPDKYEVDNGLKATIRDDLEDADGDGYPNIFEYRNGSAAGNAVSVPVATLTVDPAGGTGIFTTIQAAITATTADYQIIKVNPGTYRESLNVFRWKVLLISARGATSTILDAESVRRAASISRDFGFVGFTVRNTPEQPSGTTGFGNALNISNANGLVANCVFLNNRGIDGPISVFASSVTTSVAFRHCTFLGSRTVEGGAAFYITTGFPGMLNVSISDSILWDIGPAEIANFNGNVVVSSSIVRGGYPGSNVTFADPKLTPAGHLTAESPARGHAATPLGLDMDGEALGASGPADIGADTFVDADADGLADWWEAKYFGSIGSGDPRADTDGDGVSNLDEYRNETNPLQNGDADGDGLLDRDEILIYHTNPLSADTDGDGMPDAIEVQNGLDPLHDDAMDDADGDGYPNIFEVMRGSNPHAAASVPAPDYTVALSGTRTHSTIKSAFDAANGSGQNYRIILVAAGTYSIAGQSVFLQTQRTCVVSSAGAANTIIDGGNVGSSLAGISLNSSCALHGFTIRNINHTFSQGGALRISNAARISNCVLRGNSGEMGAVALVNPGRVAFVHCTLLNNTGRDSASAVLVGPFATVDFINSIVWDPGQATETKGYGTITAKNSIVRDGNVTGVGLAVDPLLTSDGHLRYASPARGAGALGVSPVTDMDGEPRPVGAAPDIGADQFSGAGLADADEDGMLDAWEVANGLNPLKPDAYDDADGDGVANIYEFTHSTNPQDRGSLPPPDLIVDGASGAADPTHGIYGTLQDAVAAITKPNQILEIRPGTYSGGVTIAGAAARGLWIRSSAGAVKTTIDGGGVSYGLSISTDAIVSGLTFTHCTSSVGAALYTDLGQIKVVNCVFRGNNATDGQGGGLYASASTVQVVHCTFFGNTAANGAAAGIGISGGAVQVYNSILWDAAAAVTGGSEVEATPDSALTVHACILHPGGHFTDGGSNLNVDPVLSPAFGHLAANSPAIDAGDNAFSAPFDFEGDVRPVGARCDIGADEFTDSDGDGLNDGWEKAYFGNLAQNGAGDPDGDGLSNLEEFMAGTSPSLFDTDGDGLSDFQEVRTYHTNALNPDTDGDGMTDGVEVAKGLDPLRDDTYADTDGDGIPNLMELEMGTDPQNPDTDGDGLIDGMEQALGLNPLVKDYTPPDQTPPPPPPDLTVVEITPSTVKLSWTAVTDPSAPVQYEIWRNDLLVGRTTDTSFVDNYGDPGVYAFSYYVLAVDAEGNTSAHLPAVAGSTAAGFKPLPGDADGDGIPDELDARPNDPSNAFEDDDGDGIQNRDDANPQQYDGPPPYVKILNNDDKVDYVKGESMTLTIRVSDPGAKVSIYANNAKLGDASWSGDDIFQYEWKNLQPGVHHVMAIVTDSKKAKIGTKTFLVDVAEVEAHITFVGPHPNGVDFGRGYSIQSQLDGDVVDRPILRNFYQPDFTLTSFDQPVDIHYERYYRGKQGVPIYEKGKQVSWFKIPAGEKYPLVVIREFRNTAGARTGIYSYVIDPSVPATGGKLVKVANFSASSIYGGSTPYFFYLGLGTPKFDFAGRTAGLIDAVNNGMDYPLQVAPAQIGDLQAPDNRPGYISFEAFGDYMIAWRELPDPIYDIVPGFPADVSSRRPEPIWVSWYEKYGNMAYQYVSLTPAAFAPGMRALYCYYRVDEHRRGLLWSSGIPILPEIRITPYNVGSVFYPGGRGHPANNTKPFNIPLIVNDDFDDNKAQPDNADTFIGSNDDDIVTVNIQLDLRGRTDPTKIRIKLPTDASGAPVVRGYYGNNMFLRTPLSGTETVWSIAEHPELLFDGLKFYFEGLRPQLDARVEVDLLDKNDVPVSRVFPTKSSPETLRLDVLPRARLAADQDRNGKIDTADATSVSSPFRFWINDDDDYGDTEGDDIPGKKGIPGITRRNGDGADWASGPASNADFPERGQVDGVRDLTDFFPVYLDVKPLLDLLPPSAGYKYTLKHFDGALNLVYTNLTPDKAGDYQKQALTTGFGGLDVNGPLDRAPGDAITWQVTAPGVEVPQAFLQSISSNNGGIILLEARAATVRPLRLVVEKDGEAITEVQLPLSISPVEGMFRHLNLSYVAGDPNTVSSRSLAPNWPDSVTNGKNVVFLHGYNVDQQGARGWESDIFKKLWWSGSAAKFYGVSWRGAESKVGPLTVNYHINVVHAFQTAPALAGFINHLDGEVTTIAHSLGNMVVFAALNLPPNADPTKGPAKVARHFALDAALATEALDGAMPVRSEMSNSAWQEGTWHIDETLWASEWYKLFPNDNRGQLTWRNIFGSNNAATVYNFYSSGEEVLDYSVARPTPMFLDLDMITNLLTPIGDNSWYYQEVLKGQTPVDYILGSDYGGWGFGQAYCNPRTVLSPQGFPATVYDPPTHDQISAMVWDDTKRRTRPLFLWGTPKLITSQLNHEPDEAVSDLYGSNGSAFAARNLYKLLADMIPARTFAVGKVMVPKLGGLNDKNFDLSFPPFQDGWPAERLASTFKGQRWLHSDGREIAYKYNHGLFDKWVALGQLK